MKVLIDHQMPFSLAHGGFQTQIAETKRGLEANDIEVEYVRWWDDSQKADLVHAFGALPETYADLLRQKEIPLVLTTIFTHACNLSKAKLKLQGVAVRMVRGVPCARGAKRLLGWDIHRKVSLNVVGLEAEAEVLRFVYGAAPSAIAKVPLGLPAIFLNAPRGVMQKEKRLVCVGTITERKNSVLLAEYAKAAHVPILFVGKPYSTNTPYWRQFSALIDGRFVLYKAHVESAEEMISILCRSSGAVLYSKHENWCLAAHEAAACGLPLLLPRQRWALERFGQSVRYFGESDSENIQRLRNFLCDCDGLQAPIVGLHSWKEIGTMLVEEYRKLISAKRGAP